MWGPDEGPSRPLSLTEARINAFQLLYRCLCMLGQMFESCCNFQGFRLLIERSTGVLTKTSLIGGASLITFHVQPQEINPLLSRHASVLHKGFLVDAPVTNVLKKVSVVPRLEECERGHYNEAQNAREWNFSGMSPPTIRGLLLKQYRLTVAVYLRSIRRMRRCLTIIPHADFRMLILAARDCHLQSKAAQRLLQQHVVTHHC